MSTVEMPVEQIQRMPALLGEVDVLKALQLLPGTQSGTEGTSGLYVRGGGPDQNLILLDGAPLYNVSHLFGFFSIFNADAIQNVRLIKGGFPARYGGRLSSVVDVNMKEGNLRAFQTDGAIGLLASRLTVQGPIQKDQTAFIVSGRRTYADLLARPFMPKGERASYYFYDLNAKVNHIFSSRDRVYLSAYGGDDRFYARINDVGDNLNFGFGWGNLTSTLRWNHLFSDRLFSNVTLLYSRYRLAVDGEDEYNNGTERYLLRYHSGIRDWSARADFDFVPNPNHFVRFGLHATHHRFSPGALTIKEETGQTTDLDTTLTPSQRVQAVDLSLFVEDDLRLSTRLKANVGLHAAVFIVQGETYLSLQPRLSAHATSSRPIGR